MIRHKVGTRRGVPNEDGGQSFLYKSASAAIGVVRRENKNAKKDEGEEKFETSLQKCV